MPTVSFSIRPVDGRSGRIDIVRRTTRSRRRRRQPDRSEENTPVKVEVSRFNASIFELVYPDKKERAFLRRVDSEFLEALQAEAAHESKLKKLPFGLGKKLLSPPTIEITEARWQSLHARISGSIPIVRIGS